MKQKPKKSKSRKPQVVHPTVLCVDDDIDLLKAVASGLEDRNYHVLTASSGSAAMETLRSATPDIIIADLRMDPVNGFELYQQIKNVPRNTTIPFFFLTAIDDPLAKRYSSQLGADAYIIKPVDIDELDQLIMKRLGEKRSS